MDFAPKGSNYEVALSGLAPVKIVIGDENAEGKTQPHVRFEGFAASTKPCSVMLSLPELNDVTPSLIDGVLKWAVAGKSLRIYKRQHEQYPDGALEIEAVLDSPPADGRFSFALDGADVELTIQPRDIQPFEPPLAKRRPGMAGGIVVKHASNRWGDWKAGTVCHIPVPTITVGAETIDGDWKIDPGKLTAVFDEQWCLDREGQQAVIGPTMGYTTQGGNSAMLSSSNLDTQGPYTAGSTGTLDTVEIIFSSSSNAVCVFAVHDDTGGSGYPGARIGMTSSASFGAVSGNQTRAISGNITGSSNYWITSANSSDLNFNIYYDVTGGNRFLLKAYAYDGTVPDPYPAGATPLTIEVTMWVNYTASGGAVNSGRFFAMF